MNDHRYCDCTPCLEQRRDDLRDRFAMAALTGLLAHGYNGSLAELAANATATADAMLAASAPKEPAP